MLRSILWPSTISTLVHKEFRLELRRKSVILGIGLFLVSLVFICYLTFSLKQSFLSESTWSALLWLTILFSVVNSVAKSFIAEKKGLTFYYYPIASPHQIIISKIIYNAILCLVLSVSAFLSFAILIDNPIRDLKTFILAVGIASVGFSSTLSLISAIASKTYHSNILMAVLSFPVVISILLMGIKITKNTIEGLDASASYDELLNLAAISSITTSLAWLLFPYIWRS